MAYEFCLLEQKITPHGQESVVAKSRCLAVFKKQEDGSWKFHRWMVQL
jgi:ketosteroid isomerase-like protein